MSVAEQLTITADQLAWFRLRRSGLITPFKNAVGAATSLVGLQAQVLASAGLSLSARVEGFTSDDLARLLFEERGLVKLWGQRRTLHLYAPVDWPLLHTLFQDRETWAGMTVRKLGGDEHALRGAAVEVADVLRHGGGTMTRKLLLERRPDLAPFLNLGIGLFMDIVQSGAACHARPVGSESHFAHREHWLPDLAWDPPGKDSAGVDWTRRYLRAYGPASARDVSFWMGSKASEAKAWVDTLAPETIRVNVDGKSTILLEIDRASLQELPPEREEWPVRLLHRYDVMLLSHRDKSWLVDPDRYKAVWRKAGVVDAVLLLGGRIQGIWSYKKRSKALDVDVHPFVRVGKAVRAAVSLEAERIAKHFGKELGHLSFD